MSEERLEILRMVRDKVISVEEAERLMRALDDGEQKKKQSGQRRSRQVRTRAYASAGGGSGLGSFLGGIGSTVESVVQEALEGVGVDLDVGEDDLDEVEIVDGGFAVPAGTDLRIRGRGFTGGGSLELHPVDGERCLIETAEGKTARVCLGDGRAQVMWNGGLLRVGVPATVSELVAATLGGNVRGRNLPCPLEVKTHGGELELCGLAHPFRAKTLGGNIRLALAAGLTGESKAVTLGGDVRVEIADDLAAEVTAVTLGGTVEVDRALGRPQRERRRRRSGKQKLVLSLGSETDGAASVYLKTMGGTIHLAKAGG